MQSSSLPRYNPFKPSGWVDVGGIETVRSNGEIAILLVGAEPLKRVGIVNVECFRLSVPPEMAKEESNVWYGAECETKLLAISQVFEPEVVVFGGTVNRQRRGRGLTEVVSDGDVCFLGEGETSFCCLE